MSRHAERTPTPPLGAIKPWTVGPPRVLAATPILTLNQRRCTPPHDRCAPGDFVSIDCPDWVNIIPITADNRVVMVEQFRHGAGEVTLEIPGGALDPGESPLEAAARELLEETGYTGDPPTMLGSVSPNPAIQTNRCHLALVRNAARTANPAPDTREDIAVHLVPMGEVGALIRHGAITHALVLCAFHLLGLADHPSSPRRGASM